MKRKYMRPLSETLRLNLSDRVMDNQIIIAVSGETTPEESDSKQNEWYFPEEEENNDEDTYSDNNKEK